MAASGPICWAPDAVPRITLTSPVVSTSSHSIAVAVEMPDPGRVSPALPCLPISAHSSSVAKIAPRNWATTYAGTRFHGKSPRSAKATLTAGLRWAPEMRHQWCRSTRVVLSLLCSLSVGGLGPAGATVEACRAGSSLAELLHLRGVCGDDPVLAAGSVPGGDPSAVDPVVDAGGGHAQGGGQAGGRPFAGRQAG